MDENFLRLQALGAGDFEHLNGSLIEHLQGTQHLLQDWNASSVLQNAGLYHAAYGTAGFDEKLLSLDKRHEIAEIIGKDAEELVYIYCACDRDIFFPQFYTNTQVIYTNRFTQEKYILPSKLLRDFCELTAANELELASTSGDFLKAYGTTLYQLFTHMRPYLTEKAWKHAQCLLEK